MSFFAVDNAPWNGQNGTLRLEFAIDGVVNNPGLPPIANAGDLFLDSGPATPLDEDNLFGPWSVDLKCSPCGGGLWSSSVVQTLTWDVPFVYGSWTGIYASLQAIAFKSQDFGENGRIDIDFLHTAKVVSAVVTGPDGTVLENPNVRVVSAQQVPEPSLSLLSLLGLISAFVRWHRGARA